MVSINYSSREVSCKIVYYGPGLSGKTTNLQYVHAKVPGSTRGDLISLATEADRTLYFDFLPINIGTINGFQAKFQLYTVPGQVYYNATRKLVLRGVDGLVFVADSQADKLDENIESLSNLEENLREYGYDIDDIPLVIQYNKVDLPNILSIEELQQALNPTGRPYFTAVAPQGQGVFDTLKMIIKLVLEKAKSTGETRKATATATASSTGETLVGGSGRVVVPNQNQSQPLPQSSPGAAASASGEVATTATMSPPATEATPQPAPSNEPEPESQEAAEEQPDIGYRPYPGSSGTGGLPQQKKLSSTSFAPEAQADDDSAIEKKMVDDTGDSVGSAPQSGPSMAPSLRKRNAGKKRGFFKRLFGIK